jgi:hypothetical protein
MRSRLSSDLLDPNLLAKSVRNLPGEAHHPFSHGLAEGAASTAWGDQGLLEEGTQGEFGAH